MLVRGWFRSKCRETKYMLVSRDQNAGQNRDIKIGNRSVKNVSQFKYLRTTVTNHFSEMPVLTKATQRNIPDDGILQKRLCLFDLHLLKPDQKHQCTISWLILCYLWYKYFFSHKFHRTWYRTKLHVTWKKQYTLKHTYSLNSCLFC
jgi:hypothetical protein